MYFRIGNVTFECLCLSDEPNWSDVGLRAAADATERLLWLPERAAALIKTPACLASAPTANCAAKFDSVLDYGSKVASLLKIAPRVSRDEAKN